MYTYIGVYCFVRTATEVRLLGGRGPFEGTVQVFHSGTWGGVCDRQFDTKDAKVICKMLGYSTGFVLRNIVWHWIYNACSLCFLFTAFVNWNWWNAIVKKSKVMSAVYREQMILFAFSFFVCFCFCLLRRGGGGGVGVLQNAIAFHFYQYYVRLFMFLSRIRFIYPILFSYRLVW